MMTAEETSATGGTRVPDVSTEALAPPFIARWDLDKTYLRTDFDTLRDLIRTAFERPDQKRTVPGASTLLRELGRAGVETHILSGSPEQLRSRLEEKLRLDGARWASLTLKPNLQNIMRLRFRALRGQLGYKLPNLVSRRSEMDIQRDAAGEVIREVLLGDDAESDAFVYSLYAEICLGTVDEKLLRKVMRLSGAYEDTIDETLQCARLIDRGTVVERVLIHLDRQSAPSEFEVYGPRVVPFYNYMQAAFVLHDDGRLGAPAVLRVATDLVVAHNFDDGALARSYLDLSRRGHVSGRGIPDIVRAARELTQKGRVAGASEISAMASALADMDPGSAREPRPAGPDIDFEALAATHNKRQHKKKKR